MGSGLQAKNMALTIATKHVIQQRMARYLYYAASTIYIVSNIYPNAVFFDEKNVKRESK